MDAYCVLIKKLPCLPTYKNNQIKLYVSVGCLKIYFDELEWLRCESSSNVSVWVCFYLYLHTNTLSPWHSFSLFTWHFFSLFSRFSLLPVLHHCIICINTVLLHDLFCSTSVKIFRFFFFSLCFSPPPNGLPPSLHLAPLLPESFPRRERRPRHVVTSRNSEKNSNWRRTSR